MTIQRNVTFAYNYSLSLVDDYAVAMPTEPGPAAGPLQLRYGGVENKTPNNHVSGASSSSEEEEAITTTTSSALSGRRSSARDKQGKREVSLARTRVRYDMETVPPVERNADFLSCFGKWWDATPTKEPDLSSLLFAPRRSSRLHSVAAAAAQEDLNNTEGRFCQTCDPPFLNNSSVVWVPSKRTEWEDTINEMTALCATAARRRPVVQKESAPLSRDYISDRVDIDDPINGFQIRHAVGGWLQGFIMWTNFTTWTHYFCWDSLHPQSGLVGAAGPCVDSDGSMSRRLQALPRTGDPLVSGVIFESVAEIGLVGGLKCGEYLLRMALDDIKAKKQYKFVVLQATDSSRGFYERFGFVRVGAICRYHQTNNARNGANRKKPPQQAAQNAGGLVAENRTVPVATQGESGEPPERTTPEKAEKEEEPPIVGYRHWTHANESHVSLEMHGGPSYMMCLALPEDDETSNAASEEQPQYQCGTCSERILPPASFLESMMRFSSSSKPVVEQLTTGAMLTKTLQRKASSVSISSSPAASPAVKKKTVRKPIHLVPIPEELPVQTPATPAPAAATVNIKNAPSSKKHKRSESTAEEEPPAKRRKSAASNNSTKSKTSNTQPEQAGAASKADGAATDPPVKRGRGRPKGSGKKKNGTVTVVPPKMVPVKPTLRATTTKIAKPAPTVTKKGRKKTLEKEERTFYSVRGPDGRFTRVPIDGVAIYQAASKNKIAPKKKLQPLSGNANVVGAKREQPKRNKSKPPAPPKRHKRINRDQLRKQKVKSYPRDRPHFYNRVVKPIQKRKQTKYFFVLDYNEKTEHLRLVPLEVNGTLMGKRHGRPRFQCSLGDTDANFVSATTDEYEVVDAAMVMKTPFVDKEAWDIDEA